MELCEKKPNSTYFESKN